MGLLDMTYVGDVAHVIPSVSANTVARQHIIAPRLRQGERTEGAEMHQFLFF